VGVSTGEIEMVANMRLPRGEKRHLGAFTGHPQAGTRSTTFYVRKTFFGTEN
jgi:hypothetical protein